MKADKNFCTFKLHLHTPLIVFSFSCLLKYAEEALKLRKLIEFRVDKKLETDRQLCAILSCPLLIITIILRKHLSWRRRNFTFKCSLGKKFEFFTREGRGGGACMETNKVEIWEI
jgi:hypothetical protein